MIEIVRAGEQHVPDVARLFDLYRQFYSCPADLELAAEYVRDRLANEESMIWVAMKNGHTQGFVQCYSTFCSVRAAKRWILYDLYVEAEVRNDGIGARLMNTVRDAALADGAHYVDLETAHDNKVGQHLYEALGYQRQEGFHSYTLDLRHH